MERVIGCSELCKLALQCLLKTLALKKPFLTLFETAVWQAFLHFYGSGLVTTGSLSFEARKLEFFHQMLEFFFPGPLSFFKNPEVLKI